MEEKEKLLKEVTDYYANMEAYYIITENANMHVNLKCILGLPVYILDFYCIHCKKMK